MDNTTYFERLDRLNAVHEAGHAVMTLLTGTPLGFVRLGHPDDPDSFGGNHRANCYEPEDEVLIRFAGVGAELVERNERCWSLLFRSSGGEDWMGAQRYIDALDGGRRACILTTKTKVLTLLHENWPWVQAVADELQLSRFVMGAAVEALRPALR
jgi:hypothetical protein